MFGFYAFGTAPFSGFPLSLGTAYVEQVIYAASEAFTTGPDDADVPNTYFDGRIRRALTFERSILGPNGIGGSASVGLGDIELENSDGEYDGIVSTHAIDGRRVTLRLGDPDSGFDFGDFGVIFDGTASGWSLTSSSVLVSLRDWAIELEQPVALNFYGGSGGADGTADIAGKAIPQAFGRCLNVPGVLVNPLASLVQFHDGPMQAIDKVYDSGVELPDTGTYYTRNLTTGTITMLVAIAGQITADVRGAKPGGTYINKTADIVKAIVTASLGWTDDDLNLPSFAAVNTKQPAEIGIYFADDISVKGAVDALMVGIGGYRSFTRTGLLDIGVFEAPGGLSVTGFTEVEIIGELARIDGPAQFAVPAWRQRVGYQRNWTVQTSGIASGVSAARLAFLSQDYRYAGAHDNAIKTAFLLARDADPVPAFFANQSDAETEALRLLTLYEVPRALYQGRVKTQPFTLDLAAMGSEIWPRHAGGVDPRRWFQQ